MFVNARFVNVRLLFVIVIKFFALPLAFLLLKGTEKAAIIELYPDLSPLDAFYAQKLITKTCKVLLCP